MELNSILSIMCRGGLNPAVEEELNAAITAALSGTLIAKSKIGRAYELKYSSPNADEMMSFARSKAKTDAIARVVGDVLLEILVDDACYYQHVPQTEILVPAIKNVSTDDILAAVGQCVVLILTATDIEQRAVLSAMKPIPSNGQILEGPVGPTVYRVGVLGAVNVVQTSSVMGSLGRHGSAITAFSAIHTVRLAAVIAIGIAFGVDRAKQRLGDVLIAESIFPYELARVGSDLTINRGTEMQCGLFLSNRFRELRRDWSLWNETRPVRVQQGQVLSGEKLIDNVDFRNSLTAAFPLAIGGEMEGAGIYSAAGATKTEAILVKAICDWADGHKDDRAHSFAAKAAVSLVDHVLSKPSVIEELVPSKPTPGPQPILLDLTTEPGRKPIEIMRRIAPHLYPTGPTERSIWERAGGDLAAINTVGDGRTAWFTAVRTVEKGGGGLTLEQLTLTMLEDYPNNDELQLLSHILRS